MFKSGFVTIIGKPNVGKSTLLNALVGEKLAITSRRPQTTRSNLKAVITKENYQIVFVDTPGMHKPKNKLGEFMVSSVHFATKDIDAICYVYDATAREVNEEDLAIIDILKDIDIPIFLVLNKVDLIEKERLLTLIDQLSKLVDAKEIIPLSALKDKGTDILVKEIVSYLPEGPRYYPADYLTDTTIREMVAEIIREKVLNFTSQEVPHGVGVELIQYIDAKKEDGHTHIDANLYCEKESHKGILIGKDGATLRRIGQAARLDIEELIGSKVHLKIWVKVKKDWRNSLYMLKELGYSE